MLPCLRCKWPAFSIVGLCDMCAPELHAAWRSVQTFNDLFEIRYRDQTKRSSLDDWYAYEDWLLRQADAPAYAKALNELQRLEHAEKAARRWAN